MLLWGKTQATACLEQFSDLIQQTLIHTYCLSSYLDPLSLTRPSQSDKRSKILDFIKIIFYNEGITCFC
jgi:hypothetical protein